MIELRAEKHIIDSRTLANISIILFFSRQALLSGLYLVMPGRYVATAIIYGFVVLACAINPSKYIKVDFILLYAGIVSFYLITAIVHPEYMPYYTRQEYGAWDYILNPTRGLFAYYFVRIADDEEEFKSLLKISGWIMIVFFILSYYASVKRGYWLGVGMGANQGAIEMSYSVSFGYTVLPVAILFLYYAFRHKKLIDVGAAAICIVMILVGGSRGPVLFLVGFVFLYILLILPWSKRKLIVVVTAVILGIVLYSSYVYLATWLMNLLSDYGMSSRFLTKIVNGTITADSGRSIIWERAVQMIKDNPFGYGFLGSRHVIGDIIAVGYPHSIILEMLIDFGVIIGGAILLVISLGSARILLDKNEKCWRDAFLIFFCSACCLLISLSFWAETTFWVCIGIAVNRSVDIRRRRERVSFAAQRNQGF